MKSIDEGSSRPGFFAAVGLGSMGDVSRAAGWLLERDREGEHGHNAGRGTLFGVHHEAIVRAVCPICEGVRDSDARYIRSSHGERFECFGCDAAQVGIDWEREIRNAAAHKLGAAPEVTEGAYDWRSALAAVPGLRQRGSGLVLLTPLIKRVRRGMLKDRGWSDRAERELMAMNDWEPLGVLPLTALEIEQARVPLVGLGSLVRRLPKPLTVGELLGHHRDVVERAFAAAKLGSPDTRSLGRLLREHGHTVGIVQIATSNFGAKWGDRDVHSKRAKTDLRFRDLRRKTLLDSRHLPTREGRDAY